MGIFSSSKKKNKKKLANAQADATGVVASFAYHHNTTALVIKYNLQYFPMSILRRSPMNLLDLPYLLIKWVLFFILSILEIPYNIVMRIISPVLRPINRFVIAPLMAVYFWVVFFPISFLIRVTQIPRIIGLLLGNVVGRTLWRIITFPFLYPPINWTIDLLRLLNPMRYLPVPPPGYFNRGRPPTVPTATTSGKKVKMTPSKKR